jgi:DNA invertase Pin-like site-specific DNA recombinase
MTGILGYARVSTSDQDVADQAMRLTEAGAIKVFTDVRSGRTMDRPGLVELLAYARNGDTLAVVRLDRLGRSLAELLATVSAGELVFHVFGAIAHFERKTYRRANQGRNCCRSRPR